MHRWKKKPIPEGLIASYLLKDMIEPDFFHSWNSMGWFRNTKKAKWTTIETTLDVKLFEKYNVDPSVEIHEVLDNYTQFEE